MTNKTYISPFLKTLSRYDWKLLAFLLLFLNVKLLVKLAAILLIYVMRPNFKFGLRWKNSRLPLFYISMIFIAGINWLIEITDFSLNYTLVVATGIFFWGLALLAIHQLKSAVERNDVETLHQTILLFFIINIIASLLTYAGIILETGTINPYRYQGEYQKYFIGTGDYIKGITGDTSTTNAVLNAFGVLYFLFKKNYGMVLCCMLVLLLTGSNVTNLLMCGVLLYVFIFQSSRIQKSIIIICFAFLAVFLARVSPQNNSYISRGLEILKNEPVIPNNVNASPDSIIAQPAITIAESKRKFARAYLDSVYTSLHPVPTVLPESGISLVGDKPVVPIANIHTPPYQSRNDTSTFQKDLIRFSQKDQSLIDGSVQQDYNTKLPGKLIALQQSLNYFKDHPLQMITGTGTGNFSSKLAFRVTGRNLAGGYPSQYAYINEAFRLNHLLLYQHYLVKPASEHSLINTPHSGFDQLWSEYGLVGLICFTILYAAFFMKRISKSSYALPVLLLMGGLFFMEYWFEQLSVLVFFELLLLVDIKEKSLLKTYDE